MTQLTLEEIQEEEFRILKLFSDYCNANGLKYYLAYGTLLGAVRHGGPIPWDDDTDVLMPREDYDKLERAEPFFDNAKWLSPCAEGHPWCSGKVVSLRTAFVESNCILRDDYGVFIDVFPLDGYRDSLMDKMRFWLIRRIDNLALISHYYHKDAFRNLPTKKRIAGKLGRLLPRSAYRGLVTSLSKLRRIEDSEYAVNYCSGYPLEREKLPVSELSDVSMVSYNGTLFTTFSNPTARLEQTYGLDWTTPIRDEDHIHGEAYWRS